MSCELLAAASVVVLIGAFSLMTVVSRLEQDRFGLKRRNDLGVLPLPVGERVGVRGSKALDSL
jgi:hypothetical protein